MSPVVLHDQLMSLGSLRHNVHWQATSVDAQVSKLHSKKQVFSAEGQADCIEVKRVERAAALLLFRQVTQVDASDGKTRRNIRRSPCWL